MEICNLDDFDPISYTKISEIECKWYYKYNEKTYAYDALAWLDWLVFTDNYFHPVFKSELYQADTYNIYSQVKQFRFKDEEDQKKADILIKKCQSHKIRKNVTHDTKCNKLIMIPESPIFILVILYSENRFDGTLNTCVKCDFKVEYKLQDINGVLTNKYTQYFRV